MKKITMDDVKKAVGFLHESHTLHILVLAVFILNTLIAASFAWLTINRRTGANEVGMGLAVDDTSAVYESFVYNLETGLGTNRDASGNLLDITNLDLNPYDTIFRAQNRYTPALIRITLASKESMPEEGTVIITIKRQELSELAGDSLTAYSSSTIRFTGFIMSDKSDVDITDPDALYSLICTKELFDEIEGYKGNDYENSQTFVTVNGEGADHTHDKYTSIQVFVDYDADDWYTDDSGHRMLNVYLYISYDVQLVKCYLDENKGGDISLEDTTFFFENDLTEIRVSYTER